MVNSLWLPIGYYNLVGGTTVRLVTKMLGYRLVALLLVATSWFVTIACCYSITGNNLVGRSPVAIPRDKAAVNHPSPVLPSIATLEFLRDGGWFNPGTP